MRPVYPSRRPQRQAHRRGGQGSRGAGGRGNVLDSNGPAGRLRGTAAQLQEKYRSLATDAQTHGDRVQAEAFLQYAEHYRRLLNDGGRESAREGRQSNGRGDGRANEERGEERREERSETRREERSEERQEERREERRARSRRLASSDSGESELDESAGEDLDDLGGALGGEVGGEAAVPARRRGASSREGSARGASGRRGAERRSPRRTGGAGAESDAELKKMLGGEGGNGAAKPRRRSSKASDSE